MSPRELRYDDYEIIPPGQDLEEVPVQQAQNSQVSANMPGFIQRNLQRLPLTVAQGLAAPIDIAKGFHGGMAQDIGQLAQSQEFPEPIQRALQGIAGVAQQSSQLPGSEQIREGYKQATGIPEEHLQPQGSLEEIADNAISTLASTAAMAPLLGGSFMGALTKLKALGALGGSVAKAGVKGLGGGPVQQSIGEIVGNIISETGGDFLAARPKLQKTASDLYNLRDQRLEGQMAPANKLNDKLDKMKNELEKFNVPGKEKVLPEIDALKKIASGDVANVSDIIKYDDTFGGKLFDPTLNFRAQKDVATYGDRLQSAMKEFINDYAQIDPIAMKFHNQADTIYKGLNAHNIIGRMLEKLPKREKGQLDKMSKWTKFTLGGGAAGGLGALKLGFGPFIGKAAAIGVPLAYGARTINRVSNAIMKDPFALKLYNGIFEKAAKGVTGGALMKNLAAYNKRVENIVKKLEPEMNNDYVIESPDGTIVG